MLRYDLKRKIFLCCVLTGVTVMIVIGYRHYYRKGPDNNHWSNNRMSNDHLSTKLPGHTDLDNLTYKGTKEKIKILAKIIHRAKKHVRGSKTSDYLREATLIMNTILKDMKVDSAKLYERQSTKSKHICPEVFKGGSFGFPMYYEGFVVEKCENAAPLSKLVTVVKYMNGKSKSIDVLSKEVDRFIQSVNNVVKNLTIFIAINTEPTSENLTSKYPQEVQIVQSKFRSEGTGINTLVKEVQTPYVFMARHTEILTSDSRLERLIHEIESLNVVAAGGAFRDENGHWKKGCYQSMYRNFTLKYMEGYDESFHECLFCDFIQGPFVARTEYLKANTLLDNNETSGLYEDFFLKISQSGQESVICPDSMFHVNANKTANSDVDWKPFVKKWNLHTIHTPQGQTFTQSCNTQITGSRPSQALSPCALQLINSAIKNIMSTCEKTGVICELLGGTILGVVKLGKALPWEYDYDANFLATNCTKCKQLEAALYNAGFKFRNFATSCCKRKLKEKDTIFSGGSYKGKYGDLHGRAVLDSDLLIKDGLPPTKIILDGQWVNVPRNPGLSVRNRYGKEIYRHAEHWRFSGGEHADKMMDYTADTFLPCKHPGYHDCLDRFNTDGDLSFVEMLP